MLARRTRQVARRSRREEARGKQSTDNNGQKTHSLNNQDQKQDKARTNWIKDTKTIQTNKRTWTRLTGTELVKFCLESISENIPETSICIRSGYEIKDIGQFRRAFGAAAGVRLRPLSRMATDLRESREPDRKVSTDIYIQREVKKYH